MSNPIRSYRDLDVYQNAYTAGITVIKELLPLLPQKEKYDLTDQLSRSSKAVPRLIAEGYAKKHQRAGFQKYLSDAMAEANETCVGIEQSKDLYLTAENAGELCKTLIDKYDKIGRQLYKLNMAWQNFKNTESRKANEEK